MIERCKDFRRIHKIFDGPINIGGIYLVEVLDGKDLGAWGFYRIDDGFEVHVTLAPECRGHDAAQSARAAFGWIWKNTDAPVIYAAIPFDKKAVMMLANVVGFKFIFSDDERRCYKLERSINLKMAV